MEFTKFFKKWIEPFIAVGIFIVLILILFALSNEQELKRNISESCGWADEDYRCYCQKSDVIGIENILKGSLEGLYNNDENVILVG